MSEATKSKVVELKGMIRFSQACLPPLPPDDYTLTVSQKVSYGGVSEALPVEKLHFSAAGPRFSLNPSDIYSVYPPAGHTGEFDNTLPHIVLTRKTLPWERTVDGERQDEEIPAPWMALLVLSPSDSLGPKGPKIVARKIRDREKPPEGLLDPGHSIRGPAGIELARYESENELCNTIDLPAELFQKLAPSLEELNFLAHVRSVETNDKETLAYLSDGIVSVVLANRFPESATGERGAKNLACLVSLEGFKNCLHGGKEDLAGKTVRLAVLASWVFTCHGHNNFKVVMNDLDDGPALRFADDEQVVIWKVPNRGAGKLTLGRLALNLPQTNGQLLGIRLDGEEIFGASPEAPPPAIIESDDWTVAAARRTIRPGGTSYLTFHFQNSASREVSVYRFEADFIEGGIAVFEAGNGASGLLSLPLPGPDAEVPPDRGLNAVRSAFEQGYVGLNHLVRIGEKTVSWYRGPLAPLNLDIQDYGFFPAADAALRYDYQSGLLDTTYAAAWQLGRLLALQNRPFAQAVYRYRKEIARDIAAELRDIQVRQIYGGTGGTGGDYLERRALDLLTAPGLLERLGKQAEEKEDK